MRIPSVIGAILASVAGTAAFIIACGGGPRSAGAQSCAAWEISVISVATGDNGCLSGADYPVSCRLPDGWEPFSVPGFSTITLRRCAR